MVYEKNLEALKKRHKNIYDEINIPDFSWNDSDVILENAKNGESIVVINKETKVYLNSRYNPTKEAEKYLSDVFSMPEKSILTMYGLSNGCFARVALENTCDQLLLVVYEPSKNVFMQVIKNIDISDILGNGRFVLVVEGINSETLDVILGRTLRAHNKNTSKHICLPKYAELFGDSYGEYANRIQESYNALQLLRDTIMSVGDVVCKNDIMNLKYLPGCRCGVDYVDYFPKDLPVIIVSAGPSLQKNKHLLAEAKGKALIVAVDTAISQVMSVGVKPDMVITVDFDKELKYFDCKGLDDIPFIVEPDSSYKVLNKVNPKEVIFYGTDVLLWKNLFNQEGVDMPFFEIGGSVATYAIATVISWGFKRIILIGQDLAFTGGAIHVGEDAQEYDFSTGKYSYVKSIYGEDIITRRDYLTYLKWIERAAYTNPEVEIIDATEGGALIEYTKVMDLKDVIESYCCKEYDIQSLIKSVPTYFSQNGKQVVMDKLNSMKKTLWNMKRTFSESSLESHKGSLMLSRGDFNIKELKRINACMEKTDAMLLESEERELLSRLSAIADNEFEEDMFEMETDDIKESIRMYDKCEKYYKALGDSIPILIEYIDDCLKDIIL